MPLAILAKMNHGNGEHPKESPILGRGSASSKVSSDRRAAGAFYRAGRPVGRRLIRTCTAFVG